MWYNGKAINSNRFIVKNQKNGEWITCRPNRTVFLQNGTTINVKSAEFAPSHDCLEIQLTEPHGIAVGDDVWFTIPELFPRAVALSDYPSMPAGFDAPAEYWKNQGNVLASTTTTTINSGDVLLRCRHSDSPQQMKSGIKPDVAIRGDGADCSQSDDSEMDTMYVPAAKGSSGRFEKKNISKRCNTKSKSSSGKKAVTLACCLAIIFTTVLNVEVCIAIGDASSNWLYVLLWTLPGMVITILVYGCLNTVVIARFCCGVHDEHIATCGLTVIFLVTQTFGNAAARGQAQIQAADNYLDDGQTKTIHCWRNPNETITANSSHFVFMEEPHWKVDWATASNQKVETLRATDDGAETHERFNFCVAPIVYTGNVPCQPNLYAVCARQSWYGRTSSCGWKDAQECGWDSPSNSITLRVLNNREQFWGIDDEDLNLWTSALKKVAPRNNDPHSTSTHDDVVHDVVTESSSNENVERAKNNKNAPSSPPAPLPMLQQEPVLIGWGFDGPDEIETLQDQAEAFVFYMRLGSFVTALISCVYIVYRSPQRPTPGTKRGKR